VAVEAARPARRRGWITTSTSAAELKRHRERTSARTLTFRGELPKMMSATGAAEAERLRDEGKTVIRRGEILTAPSQSNARPTQPLSNVRPGSGEIDSRESHAVPWIATV
jgi:hypothetical protein